MNDGVRVHTSNVVDPRPGCGLLIRDHSQDFQGSLGQLSRSFQFKKTFDIRGVRRSTGELDPPAVSLQAQPLGLIPLRQELQTGFDVLSCCIKRCSQLAHLHRNWSDKEHRLEPGAQLPEVRGTSVRGNVRAIICR
jgi:hypothetical protein